MEEFLKVLWMAVVVLDFHPFEVLKDINTIYSNRCEFLTFHSVRWWLWAIYTQLLLLLLEEETLQHISTTLIPVTTIVIRSPHLDPSTLGLISLLRSIHSVCRRPAVAPNWSETGHWTELGKIVFNLLTITWTLPHSSLIGCYQPIPPEWSAVTSDWWNQADMANGVSPHWVLNTYPRDAR